MAATSSIFRATRPAFRSSQYAQFNSRFTSQQTGNFRMAGRRFQSTAGATAGETAQTQQSWVKRMWDSPVGLKTVHFWAPVMKWALVLAGVSDFYRPAEKLSLTQNAALTATGAIWTRWCFVIKPRNMLLAAVNFFLGVVGVVQVSRILMWQNSAEGKAAKQLEEAKKNVVETAKSVKGKVEDVVKS